MSITLIRSLEVMKNGMSLDNIPMTQKPFYILGKLKDACDIVLDHESISRRHAVIQFKQDGGAEIYDLGIPIA